jgi:hypothetical protein
MIDALFTPPTPTSIVFSGISSLQAADGFPVAVSSTGSELKPVAQCSEEAKQLLYELMEIKDDHNYFDNASFDLYLSDLVFRMHAPFGDPWEHIEYHLDTRLAYIKRMPEHLSDPAVYVDFRSGSSAAITEVFYEDIELFNATFPANFSHGLVFGAVLRQNPIHFAYLKRPDLYAQPAADES